MGKVGAYLRLFRWPNLLIIALTQYLFRYGILLPLFPDAGLSHFRFFLLVLATLMLSAAGYAINDYFDLRIDRINKPQKIILGKKLSRRHAIFSHTLLNVFAVLIGGYLSYKLWHWPLFIVFLVVPALLWFYSIRYKRMFLVGNLLVAVMTALVVVIVWLVEIHALDEATVIEPLHRLFAGRFLIAYVVFAFFTTLIRELIKDIEDIKGDAKAGCKTVPVVLGVRSTKKMIVVLIVLVMLFAGYLQVAMMNRGIELLFVYILFFVQIPFLLLIHRLWKASMKQDYTKLNRFVKLILLAGVLSMVLIHFYLTY